MNFQIFLDILSFLIIFTILVVSHEFGHFIIAKANHIKVVEFGIGIGPKIFGFTKNDTLYALRALPFGGACVFENDDALYEEDEEKKKKESESPLDNVTSDKEGFFSDAPVLARIATVIAGPLFNIILAFILALIVVGFCDDYPTTIKGVEENSPAAQAGLTAGDKIISINGERIYLFDEIKLYAFTENKSVWNVVYERDGVKYETAITPYMSEDGLKLGVYRPDKINCRNLNLIKYSAFEVRYSLKLTFKSLKMLVTGNLTKDDISGPVGMVKMMDQTIENTKHLGWVNVALNLISLALLLSVNLGIMNMLPLPALDGGRLLLLIAEAVTGKKVSKKVEGIITLIGFGILLIIMILVSINDVTKFFRF